jgi:hypothetical protein
VKQLPIGLFFEVLSVLEIHSGDMTIVAREAQCDCNDIVCKLERVLPSKIACTILSTRVSISILYLLLLAVTFILSFVL